MKAAHANNVGPSRWHWLCIAYAFPPVNRSGTHRTLGFVEHLDRLGWDATVLTVKPDGEPVDQSLLRRVPASTSVVRTPWVDAIERVKSVGKFGGAQADSARQSSNRESGDANLVRSDHSLRDWFSRLLMTPDSRIGWVIPGVRAGLRAIRGRRPDVIYSTSPYMSAHLIAMLLSRRTRIPWVADFRDPWCGNPFRDLQYRSLERWDAWLERIALRHASHIVCATPTMTEHLCNRVPSVRDRCTTILNGFDAAPLAGVEPERIAPVGDFVLTHCGQFYGQRSPYVWFAALKRLIRQSPPPARRVHLALIGSKSFDRRPLRDLAAEAGVAEHVRVLGVKTHRETLSHMAGSDALILAGSTGRLNELQIPNKLFEYLAMRKPIVAALPQGNPGVSILRQARAMAYVCSPEDEEGLAAGIRKLADGLYREDDDAWGGVDLFERSHRAAELLGVFERVIDLHAAVPLTTNGIDCWSLPDWATDRVSPPRTVRSASAAITPFKKCSPAPGGRRRATSDVTYEG